MLLIRSGYNAHSQYLKENAGRQFIDKDKQNNGCQLFPLSKLLIGFSPLFFIIPTRKFKIYMTIWGMY